jgi:16S rRNA (adenine1518-N6/adenine1519-N6)-dimethyltransferase
MRQKFGQNFLINKEIAKTIVMAARPAPDDTVIEIGPGKGILTEILAPLVKELTCVELDPALAAKLTARFAGRANVHIVQQDFLHFPLESVPGPLKFISNLPYNMATPIIAKILPEPRWQLAVFMVQQEVAERIAAPCDTNDYSYFSLFCQYYAEISRVLKVGPGAFFPRPRVDSGVLLLKNRLPPPPDPDIFKLIKGVFQHRRKTILNGLSLAYQRPKEAFLPVLAQAQIDPMTRPQRLGFEQFQLLTSIVKKDIISC